MVVDDRTGRVLEAWTGLPGGVADGARAAGRVRPGGERAVGLDRAVRSLFVAPFLRPPLRMLHLDLAVLLAFAVSYAFFGAGERRRLGAHAPTRCSLYLLGADALDRLATRPRAPPLRLLAARRRAAARLARLPRRFRIALNLVNGNVIDVGYAGVVGADRLLDGEPLCGAFPPDIPHGDTYGPVAYAAYVPFELLWPWTGSWDDLPAAHAAAVAFDLACLAGLWLAGRRLRRPGARAAARLPVGGVPVHAARRRTRGATTRSSARSCSPRSSAPAGRSRGARSPCSPGLTKFAPLALGPLFATAGRAARLR